MEKAVIKVGIATFIDVLNYGALLQAYALGNYLSSLGYDVCYYSESDKRNHDSFYGIKWLYYKFFINMRINNKSESFAAFKHKYFKIITKETDVDIRICGSDQIWNTDITHGYSDLFWGKGASRAIAYAASCGDISVFLGNSKEVKNKIANFDFVSARERELSDYVLSQTGFECPFVCDPSLLLKQEDYVKLISKRVNIKGNYLFIYQMNKSTYLYKVAKLIARKMKLKVIEINNNLFNYQHHPHKCFYGMSIEGWLSLISQSSFVVTNSYHGMIFSILFRKPFYVIKSGKRNTRIVDLCDYLGLNERILDLNQKVPKRIEEIDYSSTMSKLEEFSSFSKQFLRNAMRYCERECNEC